jgi:outer membrane protein assembly factor BamB
MQLICRFRRLPWVLLLASVVSLMACRANEPSEPNGEATSPHSQPSAPARRDLGPSLESPEKNRRSAGHDWPVFRSDALATGVARSDLPAKLEPLWTFTDEKGGFEATAVIAEGVVYIGTLNGKFYAFNLANGKQRWVLPTSSSFTASAAVRHGLVYVGDTDGHFRCIDAATGKLKWDFEAEGEIDSSANFQGEHVLFGSQDTHLYCLDADSGKLVWKFESADQVRSFPTVVGQLGFVAGCDGHLHMIDLAHGKEVGQVDILAPTTCAPAVLDRTVFLGTEGNQFFAIRLPPANGAARAKALEQASQTAAATAAGGSDGKVLWSFRDAQHGASFRSSAAVTPQAVIVGSRDKQVHAFDPATGKPLWSFFTKGRVDSSPVVVGQRVFIGSADGRLYALDVRSGKAIWQFEAGGAIAASPAVAGGRLVIGNDSGSLYCFGAK